MRRQKCKLPSFDHFVGSVCLASRESSVVKTRRAVNTNGQTRRIKFSGESLRRWQRKIDGERAAATWLALDRDGAFHQLGQLLHDRQAQACAAVAACDRGVHLLEGRED